MNLNLKMVLLTITSSLFIFSCKCERTETIAAPVVSEVEQVEATVSEAIAKIDADGNYIYDVGSLLELILPNGTKLNVGESSTENKIFTQLSDANFVVSNDKSQGWITLDRVYFESGKANITGASEDQIKNIVEILKAFPTATVKIGGYTDNTGSDETNNIVSAERAKTVADMIVSNGIKADRIAHEGYGAQHFVCPTNDTDECKAQNRRVDLRITKK